MSPRIFLSYRWEDSGGWTRTLYDRLVTVYDADDVFFDVASMGPGTDIDTEIRRGLPEAEVVVPVMGRRWLETLLERAARPEPDRLWWEIETALDLDKTLVPVFVDGGGMPRAADLPDRLRRLQGNVGLDISPSWLDRDVGSLLEVLAPLVARRRTGRRSGPRRSAGGGVPTGGPVPQGGGPVRPTPVPPRVDTPVRLVVGDSADATHPTLVAAVSAAAPGATIELEAGTHGGPVVLDRPVTVMGPPHGECVVQATDADPVVLVRAEAVRLEALALHAAEGGVGVALAAGALDLVGCTLRAPGGIGAEVRGSSTLTMAGGAVQGADRALTVRTKARAFVRGVVLGGCRIGLEVGDEAHLAIEDSEVDRPVALGVTGSGAAEIRLAGVTVVQGRVGVVARERARVELVGCTLESPVVSAITVEDHAVLQAGRTTLRGGSRTVSAGGSASASLSGCDLAESGSVTVLAVDESRVVLDTCRLHDLGGAVAVRSGAPGDEPRREPGDDPWAEVQVRSSRITSTAAPFAVEAQAGGRVILTDSRLADVAGGVAAHDGGRADLIPAEGRLPAVAGSGAVGMAFAGGTIRVMSNRADAASGIVGPGSVELVAPAVAASPLPREP